MTGGRPALVLFARAPVPGRVKTRLATALGEDGAVRIYRAFLEDAARAYGRGPWDAALYAESDPDDAAFASIFREPWRRETQAPGDLGHRLAEAFRAERLRGARAVVAVGSDHPAIPASALSELLESVCRGEDAALIPAEDGGYCAIALSRNVDPGDAFDEIPWSSPSTLERSVERMRERGLSIALMDPAYDVDRPEDLRRLRTDLASRDPSDRDFPRSTATVLAALEALALEPSR
jgi:uncharacterized protein